MNRFQSAFAAFAIAATATAAIAPAAFAEERGLRGAALQSAMRARGMSLSAPADQPVAMYTEAEVYAGQAIRLARGGIVLVQEGGHPCQYSLDFAQPVVSVSFNRSALIAGPSGITHPVWTATAFDASGNVVGRVGEAEIRSYSNVDAHRFTLQGPGIKRIDFWGDDKGFDAFCNVVVDTMDVVTPR